MILEQIVPFSTSLNRLSADWRERLRTKVIYAAELNRQLRLKKHKLQRLADAELQARKFN